MNHFLLIRILILSSVCMLSFVTSAVDEEEVDQTLSASEVGLSYGEATILGIVEGLTEYLPVSSTGHLILTDRLLDGNESSSGDEKAKSARNAYLIVIQGGAILAVLFIYWKKILGILLGLLGRNPQGLSLGLKVLVAFIPAAITGPFLNDLIESKLFNPLAVSLALAVGSLLMIWVELSRKKRVSKETELDVTSMKMEDLSYKSSLFIGIMQCFAMWPGMSRSMVTIVGGYLVGLEAKAAAEFSFLLGFLTLSAASCYSLVGSWDVLAEEIELGPAVLGVIVATIVAFVAVKWFVGFLEKHGLIVFAFYRILLAGVILYLFGA